VDRPKAGQWPRRLSLSDIYTFTVAYTRPTEANFKPPWSSIPNWKLAAATEPILDSLLRFHPTELVVQFELRMFKLGQFAFYAAQTVDWRCRPIQTPENTEVYYIEGTCRRTPITDCYTQDRLTQRIRGGFLWLNEIVAACLLRFVTDIYDFFGGKVFNVVPMCR